MSKEILIIALGVWVAVVPYLGVPGSWRTGILILTGIVLAALGFSLRTEVLSRGSRRGAHHTFVDSIEADHDQHYDNQEKEHITTI